MGFPTASGNMNRDIMKALLDMSAFVCLPSGLEEIRSIQQQLNYDYYDFYQICPCDGLYNREMNKMLIYALQKGLGISKSAATGTWGPTTTELCKARTFSVGNSHEIIRLARYATVCNGFSVNTSLLKYDTTFDNVLEEFANSLLIEKPTNKLNYTVIKSLLSSNGDTDRAAMGCDTSTQLSDAQIETLKSNGYEIVGRYLTKVEGGLDKNLSVGEINRIFDADLRIFPVFQEYGGANSSFGYENGIKNAEHAHTAAKELGVPYNTTIYFAVDYDPQTTEINEFIVPYFEGVCNRMLKYGAGISYKVGVYGTRNVCKILKENTEVASLFVLDASYGFSGNLGFVMPNDWAFDQFAVDLSIGSGNGKVSIDKVSVSNKDMGFSYIEDHSLENEALLEVYRSLSEVFDLAMDHTENNIYESNILVAQYLRFQGGYGSYFLDGTKSTLMWSTVGGSFDQEFFTKVNNLNNLTFYFNDPATNIEYELYHFGAVINAILWPVNAEEWGPLDKIVDWFSGWAGDLVSFAQDVKKHENENSTLLQTAEEYICKKEKVVNLN